MTHTTEEVSDEGTLDPFLISIPEEARGKVTADVEFGLTVNPRKFQSVRLIVRVNGFPLAVKSLDQAYAEITQRVRGLLQGSGYPIEAGPKP